MTNDVRTTPRHEVDCPACDGAGKTYFSMHDETTQFRCDRCSGTGKIADRRKVKPSESTESTTQAECTCDDTGNPDPNCRYPHTPLTDAAVAEARRVHGDMWAHGVLEHAKKLERKLRGSPSAELGTTPECQQTINHMSRQAELLDEEGNDVSAGVMRDAMKVLVAEHQRANLLEKERDQQTRFKYLANERADKAEAALRSPSATGSVVDGVDVPHAWPQEAMDGPKSEPEALVAWLGTAARFGADEAVKIMQRRLDRLEELRAADSGLPKP